MSITVETTYEDGVLYRKQQRGPMKQKLAIATPDPELGTEMDRAVRSISLGLQRYVGIKTLVSALTGLFSYLVMKSVGLDFAET